MEIDDPQMKAAWEFAHRNLIRNGELPEHLRDVDRAGWNTVAAAHAIAQLYADDIDTAIGIAAGSGGDTDTVAAIVGAILGAAHGYQALPQRWISRLACRDLVERAGRALYRRVVIRDREKPDLNDDLPSYATSEVKSLLVGQHEFRYREDPESNAVFFWRHVGNFDEPFLRTTVIAQAATQIKKSTGRKVAFTIAAPAPETFDESPDSERVERFERLLVEALLALGGCRC